MEREATLSYLDALSTKSVGFSSTYAPGRSRVSNPGSTAAAASAAGGRAVLVHKSQSGSIQSSPHHRFSGDPFDPKTLSKPQVPAALPGPLIASRPPHPRDILGNDEPVSRPGMAAKTARDVTFAMF